MIFVDIVGIIALLFLVYLFLLSPGSLPKDSYPGLWEKKYAHRGLHSQDRSIPENSLAAFSAAIAAGYGIELDLNITTDDKIVVFHDGNLMRVCGIYKAIEDCSYSELMQYRLCDTDERIPSFREVLDLVGGRVPFIIELKPTRRNAELCTRAAALLDQYQGPYCIESFHPGIVRWFRKNRPQVVRGQLSGGLRNFDALPLYQGLLISSLATNVASRPHFVAFRHEDSHHKLKLNLFRMMGGKLAAWTVHAEDSDYCLRYFDTIIFEFFRP